MLTEVFMVVMALFIPGVIFVVIVGKLWIVPWMSIVEILKVIVRSQVGWSLSSG